MIFYAIVPVTEFKTVIEANDLESAEKEITAWLVSEKSLFDDAGVPPCCKISQPNNPGEGETIIGSFWYNENTKQLQDEPCMSRNWIYKEMGSVFKYALDDFFSAIDDGRVTTGATKTAILPYTQYYVSVSGHEDYLIKMKDKNRDSMAELAWGEKAPAMRSLLEIASQTGIPYAS